MTMANLQKLNPTQQELYNYLEQQTGQVNFEVLQPFTTQEMGAVLHISRNTVSQYLNEFFKEGWMVKINTRPVYYFLRETLSRKFNVQTLDAEYEDLQFLQQDLNHGRRADSCFAGVIGYHLSLKSAVEKCRVAVEYPPTGLPLVLAGEKGTGKRLLAGKTWEYAKEKQVVPAESRFAVFAIGDQAGHSKRRFAALKGVEQVRIPQLGSALLVQNGQTGVLVVLKGEIAFGGGIVRVLRA